MSTAVIWSKSKPDVELQYGGRLGEFHGMSSHSHLPHCRVLPPGEFNVMISELCVTLQGAVTWRNQCHDRATSQGVIIPSATLKIVFAIFYFLVFNAVWALTSGGFRIVSDTLVYSNFINFKNRKESRILMNFKTTNEFYYARREGGNKRCFCPSARPYVRPSRT